MSSGDIDRTNTRWLAPSCIARVESQWIFLFPSGSHGCEHPDGLVLQSPHDEAKDGRGGWIEPLNVVDRKQNRTASSQGAKAPQRAECNRALIRDLIIPRRGAKQCRSQRRTLHAGDLVEDFIDHGVEKVAERSERHGCLRGARSSLEHKPTSSGCAFHAGFPQGGFPDARFTDQHERA